MLHVTHADLLTHLFDTRPTGYSPSSRPIVSSAAASSLTMHLADDDREFFRSSHLVLQSCKIICSCYQISDKAIFPK